MNPDDFRGPGFQSGYDPLWVDLLAKHAEQPFHVLVGGGDQLYCDGFVVEVQLGPLYLLTLFQSRSGTRNARMGWPQKSKGENELSSQPGDVGCDRPLLLQPLLQVVSQWSVRPCQ